MNNRNEASKSFPVAVVGLGCRLPGNADDPDTFWKLLIEGKDVVGDVPPDRWDIESLYHPDWKAPGRTHQRQGGFVRNIDGFDAAFFGISPREAAAVDPQQRMLLEASHQAFENAGIPPSNLAGTDTGVFVGIMTHDYFDLRLSPSQWNLIDSYTAHGASVTIAANRISYVFDLRGPSMVVDTACSSALVALHMAVQAIRRGECNLALAGGANAMLSPGQTIASSSANLLSSRGRSQAFGAGADGYVRAEGCGMVLVEPLDTALKSGHPVLAVIRETGVNHDGRTPGLAQPGEDAQVALLRRVCLEAGIEPSDIDYVEAHGTGTAAGDPIEARALGRALGTGRKDDDPLLIGSVKTNVGHTEAAAGAVSLVKTVMALKHGSIPPSLHSGNLNPGIDFKDLGLEVVQSVRNWPERSRPGRAGINSFGFGGTNAHVILESFEEEKKAEKEISADDNTPVIVTLSAKSREALRDLAESYRIMAEENCPNPVDMAWTTALHRDHHAYRAAMVVRGRETLITQLGHLSKGEDSSDIVAGRAARRVKTAFICSGQGPQWYGMGRELLAENRIFRESLERIDGAVFSHAGWSLLEEMQKEPIHSRIGETWLTQPALFAVQVGLAACWEELGLKIDAVAGHSVGEVAAAVIAGVLSVEEGAGAIVERGRIQHRTSGAGRMMAVGWNEMEALEKIAPYGGEISVAALNRPSMVVLSGNAKILEEIEKDLKGNVFKRFLAVDVPFHSHYMDSLEDEVNRKLGPVRGKEEKLPLYSTVTGKQISGSEIGGDYWFRNIRSTVRFVDAVREMRKDGINTFIELSPHPILSPGIEEIITETGEPGIAVASLRRGDPETLTLLRNLSRLYVFGLPVKPAVSGRRINLPTYPWQRERYWRESESGRKDRLGTRIHPFISNHIPARTISKVHFFDIDYNPGVFGFLRDHVISGELLLPGAASIESALACGKEIFGDDIILKDIKFERPLFLPDSEDTAPPPVRLEIDGDAGRFRIAKQDGDNWSVHMSGRIDHWSGRNHPGSMDTSLMDGKEGYAVPGDKIYNSFEKRGYGFGPSFRCLESIFIAKKAGKQSSYDGYATLKAPEFRVPDNFILHPVLLDACFQSIDAITSEISPALSGTTVPSSIDRISVYELNNSEVLYSFMRLIETGNEGILADADIFDASGNMVASISGFQASFIENKRSDLSKYSYRSAWFPKDRPESLSIPSHIEIEGLEGLGERWEEDIEKIGHDPDCIQFMRQTPEIGKLALMYAVRTFEELGVEWIPGKRMEWPLPGVKSLPGLLRRYGKELENAGLVRIEDDSLEVLKNPEIINIDAVAERLETICAFPSFVRLVRRAGEAAASVLRGERSGVEVVFGSGSEEDLAAFYRDDAFTRSFNRLVASAVSRIAESVSGRKNLRVIELGAGTGGTTEHVLPLLADERTEYHFTDVSRAFLEKAESKFGWHNNFHTGLLDVEKDPLEQGYEKHSFDMVIAANVLHATRDLDITLENVRGLLRPGGVLLLMEFNEIQFSGDMIFGLLDGWWLFSDRYRSDYLLISPTEWSSILSEKDLYVNTSRTVRDLSGVEQTVLVSRYNGNDFFEKEKTGLEEKPIFDVSVCILGSGKIVEKIEGFVGDKYGKAKFVVVSSPAEIPSGVDRIVIAEPARVNVELGDLDVSLFSKLYEPAIGIVLDTVNSLGAETEGKAPIVLIVTAGVMNVCETDTSFAVAQSPVWGLGRVLANEYPSLGIRLIDLSYNPDDDEISNLAEEIISESNDTDIALRGTDRFVLGVEASMPESIKTIIGRGNFKLKCDNPGLLDSLYYEEADIPVPGPGEVTIDARAAGLNFRDVMIAQGLMPREDIINFLGGECSGTIREAGEGSGFSPGDEVVAVGRGMFAGVALARSDMVLPMPKNLSFAQAAAIPLVYCTAAHVLDIADLRKGESVLIHSASGGFGLAAIEIARRKGAVIYATAGSERKRDFLAAMGIDSYDSSSDEWYKDIMRETGGRGVDVILNSLSGSGITRGIECLADYGRFIELGMVDIHSDSRIGLAPFRKNISFMRFDISFMERKHPERFTELFRLIMADIEAGRLSPPLFSAYPAWNIRQAFHRMSGKEQVGKLVVEFEKGTPVSIKKSPQALKLRPDRTYLVTGGTRGLGLSWAGRLIDRGARNLLLWSRTGKPDPEDEGIIEGWRDRGLNVCTEAVDVGDLEAVNKELSELARKNLPPLGGITHGAMVLDDAPTHELDRTRMWRALSPKACGALNLHHASLHFNPEWFLFLSSVSGIFGMLGQANYNAANLMLERIADARRNMNLPASVVSLGAISSRGFVSRNMELQKRLNQTGFKEIPLDEAMDILERTCAYDADCLAAQIDLQAMVDQLPGAYSRLKRISSHIDTVHNETDSRCGAKMKAADAVSRSISRLLGMSPDKLPRDIPVTEFGMDSLVAAQLSSWIQREFGVRITSMAILRGPSIEDIAGYIERQDT